MKNNRSRGAGPDPGDSLKDDAALDGSGEFDAQPVGADAEAPPATGFESVDPAAGGPQAEDVSTDYASRNGLREREAADVADNRSNPAGEDPVE